MRIRNHNKRMRNKARRIVRNRADEDHKFLLNRAMQGGRVCFTEERECGVSSNSIVAIAYGLIPPDEQKMPYDKSDYKACEKMWEHLPSHRKTRITRMAMERAETAYKR